MAKLKSLSVAHGEIELPIFLPDATFGFVRALDSYDLRRCGIRAVVMNVFHLMGHPGSSVIKAMGGLHEMFGWRGPLVTDSGGFQIFSLLKKDPESCSVTGKGFVFHSRNKKLALTPEKSIQLQLSFGADVLICLDHCTSPEDPKNLQEESVLHTIDWAERCKAEFEKHASRRKKRPLLLAVIQGGRDKGLRRKCFKELSRIGFDGYGYGGYPFDGDGKLLEKELEETRRLVPKKFPLFALGIGSPENIVRTFRLGYDMFDSSFPTRDARHGRLYESDSSVDRAEYVYISDDKHIKSREPLSEGCDCHACRNYSRAYMHHLFGRKDPSYFRLATMHNLRFITMLVERLTGD